MIVGLMGGYLIFSISAKNQIAPVVGGGVPQGGGSATDYQTRIMEAEKIVTRDPKNLQAWIQLGNDYFDTGQPQKAINAYAKALEIRPNDPNVLTDQGVMYKQLGEFNKAVANFEKANQIDPKHLHSLYNLGLTYADNLKQMDKASKAWERFLEIDSTSPTAQQVKASLEQYKSGPKTFKK